MKCEVCGCALNEDNWQVTGVMYHGTHVDVDICSECWPSFIS